jgi:hypothetical protein
VTFFTKGGKKKPDQRSRCESDAVTASLFVYYRKAAGTVKPAAGPENMRRGLDPAFADG